MEELAYQPCTFCSIIALSSPLENYSEVLSSITFIRNNFYTSSHFLLLAPACVDHYNCLGRQAVPSPALQSSTAASITHTHLLQTPITSALHYCHTCFHLHLFSHYYASLNMDSTLTVLHFSISNLISGFTFSMISTRGALLFNIPLGITKTLVPMKKENGPLLTEKIF